MVFCILLCVVNEIFYRFITSDNLEIFTCVKAFEIVMLRELRNNNSTVYTYARLVLRKM